MLQVLKGIVKNMEGMGVPDLISAPIMAKEAGIESVISTVSRFLPFLFLCFYPLFPSFISFYSSLFFSLFVLISSSFNRSHV